MNHCIVCTEYPPAHIPPGGIGTYVYNIAHLLAEAGETVHVIGRLWPGAPDRIAEFCNGRLIVHRVPVDEPLPRTPDAADPKAAGRKIEALRQSEYTEQCFAWQASLYLERLVDEVEIDVIEAQEVNAPVYFFLLRRALGLGPAHQPPCIIHLHSSSELVARYNEWDAANPGWVTAKRLEDYCIGAADALLCPSQFLARQTEREFGLTPQSVTSIPLPIGDTPLLERTADIWRSGSICYFGRLEPRKGVIEWVDAAVSVADDYPDVNFEFIGADLNYTGGYTVQQYVQGRIPRRLRDRFRFRGSHAKDKLLEFLGQARAAVVPSRWENFPNTCVEAMCTGLPVLASPNGGMAEMIEDGQTGWISAGTSAETLAVGLRRVLDTPPERLAAMGERAGKGIRQICDNDSTVARHLAFRERVVERGAQRSLRLPSNLPLSGKRMPDDPEQRAAVGENDEGIAVILNAAADLGAAHQCLTSLEQQDVAPVAAVVIVSAPDTAGVKSLADRVKPRGWRVAYKRSHSLAVALNEEISRLMAADPRPLAFAFLDPWDTLYPGFISSCERVLRHTADVGVVSMWVRDSGQENELAARPCPAFPYQLIGNETAPTAVMRAEALAATELFQSDLHRGFERWQLINSILAQGWKAVTIPAVLASRVQRLNGFFPGADRMYQALLGSTPGIVARYAEQFVHLIRQGIPDPASLRGAQMRSSSRATSRDEMGIAIVTPRDLLAAPMSQKIRIARKLLKDPRPALRFISWHVSATFRRLAGRAPNVQ